MENIKDLISLLQEKHDIVKSLKIEFSSPDVIKLFNIEYFRPKINNLPGGVSVD